MQAFSASTLYTILDISIASLFFMIGIRVALPESSITIYQVSTDNQ